MTRRRLNALIRVGLGLLLATAAGLKLYGLGVSAVPRVGWFSQPGVQLAAAEWELTLGLWLISGACPAGSWLAAAGTFLAFAGVSGYLGFTGVSSCGCLGAIHASPWWAFGVDVAALVLLAVGRPHREAASPDQSSLPVRAGLKWAGGTAVLLIGITAAATALYGSPDAALARLRGESLTADPYLDLGSGKPGDALEGAATIRNVTDRPIRLVGGTSDCSCTVLRDLPATVEPGGSVTVGVRLKIPDGRTGRLTRTVFLRTDDPDRPVVRFAVGCRVE
jgi:hypothetical protein